MICSTHHTCSLEKALQLPWRLCNQKSASSSEAVSQISDLNSSYAFEIQTNSALIPIDFWKKLADQKSLILHPSYLNALSRSPLPSSLQNRASSSQIPTLYYVTFYDQGHPIGIAAFSITYYQGASIKELIATTRPKISHWMQKLGLGTRPIQGYVLTCGGSSLSGGPGFAFTDKVEKGSEDKIAVSLIKAAQTLKSTLKDQLPLNALLFQKTPSLTSFTSSKYTQFQTEPNLTLPLSSKWTTFELYLQDLKSKYRIKAKRADTKSKELIHLKLTPTLLKKHHQDLVDLYLPIEIEI